MRHSFLNFLNKEQLCTPADCVLLAVSGGVDSVVMVDLFAAAGQAFAIAHVNFGLRGAESDADARFVAELARQYGVRLHTTRFDTATVAAQAGVSTQMAARDLRYAWFEELADGFGYAAIATAHHQDDVLETVLLNLTRGTGLTGLHGIRVRRGRVIRPLLWSNRADIEAYAQTQGLRWREDSSNASDYYRRNLIRHHVVPVLKQINPSLEQTMRQTAERLRAADVLLTAELRRRWEQLARTDGEQVWLSKAALAQVPEPVFCLSEWLKPFGLAAQAEAIWRAVPEPAGAIFLSSTHRLSNERTDLLLTPRPPETPYELHLTDWPAGELDVAGRFRLRVVRFEKPAHFRPPADPAVACFDADRLTLPLTIRPWQRGDRFQPLGMSGQKLVSDLLNDLKLTVPAREQAAVLLSGNKIAWVIGRRLAHPYRLTEATRSVVQITLA